MNVMDIFSFSTQTEVQTLKAFSVDSHAGLNTEEAHERLKKYSANEISAKKIQWFTVFARQFRSSFIYLLGGAMALAFLLGERTDGLMILLFVLINTGLGFYQEYKSERTLLLLRSYITSYAKVVRDGKEAVIPKEELVPGDIALLETGDKIPADVRFLETHDCAVDESSLTGESVPVKKQSAGLAEPAAAYHSAFNLGLSGTIVASGAARAVVIATGRKSVLGKIARLTLETRHVSGFEKSIAHFSKVILNIVLATLLFIFVMNLLINRQDRGIVNLLIFSIALAVSVIPEALPVVTTFSLSRGAIRLAKKKVAVRRLSAIEDLGGIDVLCTDKTGTLTENQLTVESLSPHANPLTLIYGCFAAGSQNKHKHDPFDIALFQNISTQEQKKVLACRKIGTIPFDPRHRHNGAIVQTKNGYELILRGAPEFLLHSCKLAAREKKELHAWIAEKGGNGKRTLAITKKKIQKSESEAILECRTPQKNGFELLGIIAFTDPLKPTAIPAVKLAKGLGITIKILTGDSKEIAGSLAHTIGLSASPHEVITGTELEALSAHAQYSAVEKYAVFARISPEQKYAIIKMLGHKHRVGFLGEGINDAPALKAAEVSLVVQSASGIARDAADIVLLKKDLKVIIEGIKEGREVFVNTVKYIKATLASNFGNFYAVAVSSLFIPFLPMLPIQILLLNLLSDSPMIAISTDTIDTRELASPKQYDIREIIMISTVLGIVSTVFDFIFFALFYRISPSVLQTNWFIGSILTELAFLFSIRTKHFFLKGKPPSILLILFTAAAGIATVLIPYSAFGQRVFQFTPPSQSHLLIILSVAALYFVCTECVKLIYYRHKHAVEQT